jgi:hypothetical protein
MSITYLLYNNTSFICAVIIGVSIKIVLHCAIGHKFLYKKHLPRKKERGRLPLLPLPEKPFQLIVPTGCAESDATISA